MTSPFQTTKEEWDSFFEEMKPRLLEWFKASSTSVDAVETYDPTDYAELAQRVKSLPARYNFGGTRKTVLVPLDSLSWDAKNAADEALKAAEDAAQATEKANTAAQNAGTAADNANRAAQEADSARSDLEQIKNETNAAKDAANSAAARAEDAANKAETDMAIFSQQEAEREREFKKSKEAFDEFAATAESNENERIEAEKERQSAELQRQQTDEQRIALDERFKSLTDNPPKVMGDNPPTWWYWNPDTGAYEDSGTAAVYPDIHIATKEEIIAKWNEETE